MNNPEKEPLEFNPYALAEERFKHVVNCLYFTRQARGQMAPDAPVIPMFHPIEAAIQHERAEEPVPTATDTLDQIRQTIEDARSAA